MRRIGVIGTMVWDIIHGRDPVGPPTEEWGGIAYALAGMDAALDEGWELVPLIRVGRDLAPRAGEFLRELTHLAPAARFIEVPAPNNRVVLRYQSAERRCERMEGGVPGWTWPELGPLVTDLDALYVNFISGFEMCLGTAQALRQGFRGPIYADLHSLFLGMQRDGMRMLQPLPDAPSWFGCFDAIQVNEDEMHQLSPDPMGLSAAALGAGVSLMLVTLGPRGTVYVAAPGFAGWGPGAGTMAAQSVQTALVTAPRVEALDPTGCGDVFGAACCARLVAGVPVPDAIREANAFASRNATYRGAGGLVRHLRGELVAP